MTKSEAINEVLSRTPAQPRVAVFDYVADETFSASVRSFVKEMVGVCTNNDLAMDLTDSKQVDDLIANAVHVLPRRATQGSMGYDFYSPFSFVLEPQQSITIPTGVRCATDPSWGLVIGPKSGKGSRYRVMLRNTLAFIDSDFFFSDDGGHIILKLINDNYDGTPMSIHAGDSIMQGLLIPYGITFDDDPISTSRNGGFGSTVS